jgi:hypothetical protein
MPKKGNEEEERREGKGRERRSILTYPTGEHKKYNKATHRQGCGEPRLSHHGWD